MAHKPTYSPAIKVTELDSSMAKKPGTPQLARRPDSPIAVIALSEDPGHPTIKPAPNPRPKPARKAARKAPKKSRRR